MGCGAGSHERGLSWGVSHLKCLCLFIVFFYASPRQVPELAEISGMKYWTANISLPIPQCTTLV